MDVVEDRFEGGEMHSVEVGPDPGEAMVGVADSPMCMEDGIDLDTVSGDGRGGTGALRGGRE